MFIRALVLALKAVVAPLPAYANECIVLWLEHNGICDRHGYRDQPSLAKRYFDNSGCMNSPPGLSDAEQIRVNQILRLERRLNCGAQNAIGPYTV